MKLNLSPSLWLLRLLLAALLFFGSELVLWQNIPQFTFADWLIKLIGYPLLATLILDIAQRYRIRDGYDAMVLLAGSALLHSIIINPSEGWSDLFATLLTRIIGAEALTQTILWAVFLALLRGDKRRHAFYQMIALAWLGLFWGIWMRWIPELRGNFEPVPIEQMLIYAGIVFAVPIFLYVLTSRFSKEITPPQLLLYPLEWGIAALLITSLYLYQAIIAAISIQALLVAMLVLFIVWLILWFRREAKQESLLEKFLPLKPQIFLWLPLAGLGFGAIAYGVYQLPRVQASFVDLLWLMEIGFFAIGLLWLPFVAAVLAVRAFDRLMREGATL